MVFIIMSVVVKERIHAKPEIVRIDKMINFWILFIYKEKYNKNIFLLLCYGPLNSTTE